MNKSRSIPNQETDQRSSRVEKKGGGYLHSSNSIAILSEAELDVTRGVSHDAVTVPSLFNQNGFLDPRAIDKDVLDEGVVDLVTIQRKEMRDGESERAQEAFRFLRKL